MTNSEFCSACGWLKPIVREEQHGKRTLKFCGACNAVAQKAQHTISELVQDLTAKTEREPETLWQARNPEPEDDIRTADEQYRQLRRFFRMGFLLGALLATGIAFAFFNFIVVWGT